MVATWAQTSLFLRLFPHSASGLGIHSPGGIASDHLAFSRQSVRGSLASYNSLRHCGRRGRALSLGDFAGRVRSGERPSLFCQSLTPSWTCVQSKPVLTDLEAGVRPCGGRRCRFWYSLKCLDETSTASTKKPCAICIARGRSDSIHRVGGWVSRPERPRVVDQNASPTEAC